MATQPAQRRPEFDLIEPIGKRIVIRKDDNKRETRSGIALPDSQLEHDNRLFVVAIDKVLAIFRQTEPKPAAEQ